MCVLECCQRIQFCGKRVHFNLDLIDINANVIPNNNV